MSTRNFHIMQNLFYLLLIGVVCFMIRRPYDALDLVFKEHYLVEEQRSIASVKNYISIEEFEMNQRGAYDKVLPYYINMVHIDSATKQLIAYIDTLHRPVKSDSLQNKIDKYATEVLSAIPKDSANLGCFMFEIRGYAQGKTGDGRWLNCLLRGQSAPKQELIILGLRSDIYGAEKMVLKKLIELSHIRCCGCVDSVVVPFNSSNHVFNQGDLVKGYLILSQLPRPDTIEFRYGDKTTNDFNRIGNWFETAHAVGDYTIKGFVRSGENILTPSSPDIIWDTIPWSFQYRVAAKGICLVHAANQVCYRQGANPISVSIPGYAHDKVRLRAKGATFINNGNGHWTFTLTDKQIDNITVYADATDRRGHIATVHAAKFPVINMGALTIGIDGIAASTINASDLLHSHQLTVMTEEGNPSPDLVVTGYKLCIINANNKLLGDYTIPGDKLDANSSAVREACKELAAGAHMYITDILVRDNAGEVFPASSFLGIAVQ